MTTPKRLILFLVLAVAVLAPALCQELPNGVKKVTSVEGITEYSLENGLHFLIFPDPSKPTITVNITYLVGSRHEGSGEGGMAHLLEHMLFKGSTHHTNIMQELTEHGSRPNGSTDFDRTNYFETFQASDENLKWALDLESDRMVNSFIKKEDFDKEFSVVRNEFEMGENNPFAVLYQRTMTAAYTAHNYGRPVIGNKSDVERVPIDQLQAFYHKYYQPDDAVLMVAGKVDEPKVVTLVSEYFGKIPRPERKLNPTHTVEPTQDGERLTVVRRIGDVQGIFIVYHTPDGGNADQPVLDVLASVMGEQSSGRLYKALVDNKKATQVFAQSMQHDEPGLIMFGAILNKTDSLDTARDTMLTTIDGVVKEPPSKEEVDRAKTRLEKQVDMMLRNSEQVGLFMSEYLAMGDWRLLFYDRDLLRKVTPADVQRVATAYLKSSNRTIGEFIPDAKPDRSEIPAKTDVAAVLKDYKGASAMQAGEVFDPSTTNIESRVQRYTLPSGMKVSLLEKKTRGGAVRAVISLHFGDVESLKDLDTIAGLAGSTLIRGTTHKNRQQIQDEIDRLKAQVNVGGGPTGANVSIETVHDNLPAVLRLAGEILKEATLPEAEFEEVRKEELTQLEFGKTEPQYLAFTEIRRIMYPFPKGDVRGELSIPEQIEETRNAKLGDAVAFYKHFYGASNGQLAVVGDFDPAEVKKEIAAQFGEWKSPAHFERVKTGFQKIAAVNRSIETPDKKNAVFIAATRINIDDSDPDYPALLFGNYMLGGGFLNSRLATRIRVKDGLSYGVGSSLSAKSHEKDGEYQAFAIAAPQNVAKVEAAFKEEMERALKDGFTQKEMDDDRNGWLQSQQVNRAEDGWLVRALSGRDYDGRTMSWDADLEKKVSALTPDDVVQALRRHIDLAQISIIKAGDFKSAESTK
ncbi:MAG TPA: pitrilysin family protein [Bryobacteraceae bacterium]|nr:pitrilysin family protein [Bryobacteraceae bacterium]